MRKFVFAIAAISFAASTVPAAAFSTQIVPLNATHVAVVAHGNQCNTAATLDSAPYADMPDIAAAMGVGGLVKVRIDLNSTGSLASESLYATSGNKWLDQAALRFGRTARFTAEKVNCEFVAGSYLYEVQF